MADDEEQRRALAVGAIVFGVAVPLTYAFERLVEWSRGEHGDPRLILRTLHTAYYWRAGLAFWWGGAVAILVYAWLRSGRDPAKVLRTVAIITSIGVPLFLLATWRFP